MPNPAAPPGEDHWRLPRRRSRVLDAAILEATIAEIDEAGYANLSIERVAERAGPARRRCTGAGRARSSWVAAIYEVLPDPAATADTGSLREDLLALFRTSAKLFVGPAATAVRGLLSDALRNPELAARFRAYTRENSGRGMREVVRRAGERGELVAESISPRQLDAGLALMRFHFLTHDGPVPDEVIVGIVNEVAYRYSAPRPCRLEACGRRELDHRMRPAGTRMSLISGRPGRFG